MEPIKFRVDGALPPKKDGGKSMWSKESPVARSRLLALRKKARAAFKEPFACDVKVQLKLRVHVGFAEAHNAGKTGPGDLDNFVTGVCDGLMSAHQNVLRHHGEILKADGLEPDKPIAFTDDSQVVTICATRIVATEEDEDRDDWYEVEVAEVKP